MNFKKYLALGTALTLTLLAGCGSPRPRTRAPRH